MVDCEHFFDGYKANPSYALECARTAHAAGARWVILRDTTGGTQPAEIRTIVEAVIAPAFPAPRSASTPTTTRARRSPPARRHRGRRPADPGHAERHRRALRYANLVTIIPTA